MSMVLSDEDASFLPAYRDQFERGIHFVTGIGGSLVTLPMKPGLRVAVSQPRHFAGWIFLRFQS